MRCIVGALVSVSLVGCFADAPPVSDDGSSGNDGSTDGDDDGATSSPTGDPSTMTASADADADADASDGADDDDATSNEPDTGDASTDGDDGDSTSGTTMEVVVLDFVEAACDAVWENDEGIVLPCPGGNMDMQGYVFPAGVDGVTFEDGSLVTDPALVMHPRWVPGGLVQGRYAVDAQAGDVFRATIGCVQAESMCNVELRLRDTDGQNLDPSPWSQTADGTGELVEVELSASASGLVLEVYAGEDPGSDASIWIEPQLVRLVPH